jgi:serine/threonine protein phosphatase 1
MRRFVIGDIHGAYKALMQCFERSGFDRESDQLVCLGDVCDGWPDVPYVIEELLHVQKLVYLLGNHDQWLLEYFLSGNAPGIWLMQGGSSSVRSYKNGVPAGHMELLKNAGLYHVVDNILFVHGGMIPGEPVEYQDEETLLWDRSLVYAALDQAKKGSQVNLTGYDMVYVGHTPTINFGETQPIIACGVCLLDTGAGWSGGVLSMMDIDSRQYYQSDQVDQLYKGIRGRNG